ncbi:MAG TPA: glycosyltransferase family 1 protein [Pyrinomonadaceae bacterium]|nr:glycosyltransferase family 1 protein [Pyrinomonadaceae bacterium]
MRILYDGAIFVEQSFGGITRYFNNLIARLPDTFTPIVTTFSDRRVNSAHANLKVRSFTRFRPGCISYPLAKYYFEGVSAYERPNLAHPTYYYLLANQDICRYRFPVAITVYDMIYELFPDKVESSTRHYVIESKRKAIMSAQALICISEKTKRDLLRFFPGVESKVTVIPLATDLDESLSYGGEPVPDRPYFLFVGDRAGYKNFAFFLNAFARAIDKQQEAALAIVGQPLSDSENGFIERLGLSKNIEYYGLVSDRLLAKLYRCSLALIYPSLYEGFGIPPLEAFACGTIVVAAEGSGVSEIVGSGCLFFKPEDTSELADILQAIINGLIDHTSLVEAGRHRSREFNWERTASQTVDLYLSLSSHA